MFEENTHEIVTVSDIRAYLNSLEKRKQREKNKRTHDYKIECSSNMTKVKKRDIVKIEKAVEKEYISRMKLADEILELLDEAKAIPEDVERLEIAEYMLYRVDMRKSEKIVNRASKKLTRRYIEIQKEVAGKIKVFPMFKEVREIDYSEYNTSGDEIQKSKEQYKLEYTEEEREKLIEKELNIIEQVKAFNSVPIAHEILKNSDKDIQSKMQKFNSIRQKRIRILTTMEEDYKRLITPRELLNIIDEATKYLESVKHILARAEYNTVKKSLLRRRKRIYRNTNDVRNVIKTKEKKTGILNFNIQQARYYRMEGLRNTILDATALIKENPIEQPENQLEKLKIAYEREKQFASVIENLNGGMPGNTHAELRAYEEQISMLQYKVTNSRRIVKEQEERIRTAKKELIVLWKMEINEAIYKKKEVLALGGKNVTPSLGPGKKAPHRAKRIDSSKKAVVSLRKVSGGKHAALN